MPDLFNSFSTNDLVVGLAVIAIVAIITWAFNAVRNYREKKLIYSFLEASRRQSPHTFRSTEAIAAHTKLTEDRVERMCTEHPKIKRNTKEKQSWRLID